MNNFESNISNLNASPDAQELLEKILNPDEILLLEKMKEEAETIIQDIGPDLEISFEAQTGKPFIVFTNKKLDIIWGINLDVENGKFMSDNYLKNNFEKEIIKGYISELSRRVEALGIHKEI